MSLEFLKCLNNDKINVASLDSNIVSFMETDNHMATAPQALCPDENVKI